MITPTPIVKLPQPFDGPFLNNDNFGELQEILDALQDQSLQISNRICLALELFEHGAQETSNSKFFYYWSAIEVLCDTHRTARILGKLANAYAATRGHVQNELGFDLVKLMRTDLFHRGISHDVPQDVERYIQAMFIDLLRLELSLACRRQMEYQIREGFSIDRLRREIGQSNVVTIDAT